MIFFTAAVVVEMKKSSPIIFDREEQIVTEAGLFIHPITYDDFGIPPIENEEESQSQIQQHQEQQIEPVVIDEPRTAENLDVNNNLEAEQRRLDEQEAPAISPEPDVEEIIRQAKATYAQEDDDEEEELDSEMQRKIEEMIESVMNSAREETEWRREMKESNAEPVDETHEQKYVDEVEQPREVVEEICVKKEKIIIDSPPLPPPRRKSNLEESILARDSSMDAVEPIQEDEQMPMDMYATQDSAPNTEELQLEKSEPLSEERPSSPFPSRLHISSLEIDNLSVNALQAGRISASEIDSHTIVTNEFECRSSSTLPQAPAIELPPGLIEQIVERVRNAERAEMQAEQHRVPEEAPSRPPLPSEYSPTSPIPPSFYQLRDPSEEDPAPRHRRRRHHPKRRESTSEEEYQQKDQRQRPRSGGEQSITALGSQFARACGNALIDSGSQLMEILRASSKDENKRDLHVAIMILVIIVAGLFLMNVGEKSVHHHHWDFFNPPENPGR
jgi:hypothetical protein